MNICCIASDPAIDSFLEPLKEIGPVAVYHKQNLSSDDAVKLIGEADVLITGPEAVGNLTMEILSQLPNLKLLSLLTVGTNWVDLEYAKKANITLRTIKGATAESVAEHIWAMILSLAKRVYEFDHAARYDGKFNFADFKGKEVYGKKLGVLGLGDIGTRVARIGKAFSMEVIGVHTTMKPVEGVRVVDKKTLLKEADVIAICIPLNKETEGYISKKEIREMKDGVIVVNCAREKIVDKEAMLESIESGKVFGYGVETPIMKEVPKDDPYYRYPNVIVTPHNAFNTKEANARSYQMVVEGIQSANL